MALNGRIRAMIAARGISQAEAARRMGTSPSNLNRFLSWNGASRAHTIDFLERAAAALDCRLEINFIPNEDAKNG